MAGLRRIIWLFRRRRFLAPLQICLEGFGLAFSALKSASRIRGLAHEKEACMKGCLWGKAVACGGRTFKHCCRSSVVEHSLGKGEVVGSIPPGSTILPPRHCNILKSPAPSCCVNFLDHVVFKVERRFRRAMLQLQGAAGNSGELGSRCDPGAAPATVGECGPHQATGS